MTPTFWNSLLLDIRQILSLLYFWHPLKVFHQISFANGDFYPALLGLTLFFVHFFFQIAGDFIVKALLRSN